MNKWRVLKKFRERMNQLSREDMAGAGKAPHFEFRSGPFSVTPGLPPLRSLPKAAATPGVLPSLRGTLPATPGLPKAPQKEKTLEAKRKSSEGGIALVIVRGPSLGHILLQMASKGRFVDVRELLVLLFKQFLALVREEEQEGAIWPG